MLEKNTLLSFYQQMLRIRLVETALSEKYAQWEMRCPMHLCVGQEATAVGICQALNSDDVVYSNHRAHGHYLAKGGDLKAMIAEIYGKSSGCSGGRGGSMHLIDLDAGFMGSTPIVAGTVPLAVGAAWAFKLQQQKKIAVIFIGDGCFEEGVLHESMNFAALHRLPLLMVCENNQYSVYTHLRERQPDRPIYRIAQAHGFEVQTADGNDVSEIYGVASKAVSAARQNGRPQFIELNTYRWLEHCGPNDDDKLGYRSEDELASWIKKDPIEKIKNQLLNDGVNERLFHEIKSTIADEIAEAFLFAKDSASPHPDDMKDCLYA